MAFVELINERGQKTKRWRDDIDPRLNRVTAAVGPVHFRSDLSPIWDREMDFRQRVVSRTKFAGITSEGSPWAFGLQTQPDSVGQLPRGCICIGDGTNFLRVVPLQIGFLTNTATWVPVATVGDLSSPVISPNSIQFGETTLNLGCDLNWPDAFVVSGVSIPMRGFVSPKGWYKEFRITPAAQAALNALRPINAVALCLRYRMDVDDVNFFNGTTQLTRDAFDETADEIRVETRAGLKLGYLRRPRTFVRNRGGVAQGRMIARVQDGFVNLLLAFPLAQLAALQPGDWLLDPAIPQESIGANSDDCGESSGSNNLDGQAGYLRDYSGRDGSGLLHSGFRFTSVGIPAGSTISATTLLTLRRRSIAGTPTQTLYADTDRVAPTWQAGTGVERPNGTGVTRTTASVAWNTGFGAADNTDITTPSLVGVVQELATAGAITDIRFVLIGTNASGSNYLGIEDFADTGSNNVARFDCFYTAAGGAMGGSAAITFGQTAPLSGAGALAGPAAIIFGQTAPLSGAGALAGNSPVTFGNVSPLSGNGALAGSSGVTFSLLDTLAGSGVLAGSSAIDFSLLDALIGSGRLAGPIPIVFSNTGTLTNLGSGDISGIIPILFGEAAVLIGEGALSGSIGIIFDHSTSLSAPGLPTIGGGSSRRRRRWYTVEEFIKIRKEQFRYVPAPETPREPISQIVRGEIDYNGLETRIICRLIEKQEAITAEIKKNKKRKMAISLLLLDS